MAMPPQKKSRLIKAVGWLAAGYVRLVARTSSIVIEPSDPDAYVGSHHPFIMAFWHGQFLMLPARYTRTYPVSAMVARHGDAEIIGEILASFGMTLIRGAGAGSRKRNRGGATALRLSLRALAENATLAMTADVPPGPAREAGQGIVTIARMSGRPILPFAVASSRYMSFPTWSRLTINLPFSRIAYVVGNPISVPSEAAAEDLPRYQKLVSDELNRVTARAYELAGADMTRATPPARLTAESPPAPPGLALALYSRATSLLRVIAPLLLGIRKRQGKEEAARIGERYGIASGPRPDGPLLWIHAASVGETIAILPLLEKLEASRPDLNVLLTTGTVTSAHLASRRLGNNARHQYVPLDTPQYVARFLDHWRPDLAVFTESEIWPNLILSSRERQIPLVLVNGRMSSRSAKSWRRMKSVARPLFSSFSLMLAQNEGVARIYTELGRPQDGRSWQSQDRQSSATHRCRSLRTFEGGPRRSPHASRNKHAPGRGRHRRHSPRHNGKERTGSLHHHRPPPSLSRASPRRDADSQGPQRSPALQGRAALQRDRHLHCRHHRRTRHTLCGRESGLHRRLARPSWRPEPH